MRPEGTFGSLRYPFGGDHPSQTTRLAQSPLAGVRPRTREGPYFKGGSPGAGAPGSRPPAYPTRHAPWACAKLQ